MKYTQTHPDENYPIIRYLSENNKWEFGYRMMISGLRFNANPVGAMGYTIEYCSGQNTIFRTCLNGLMLQIFELLPESITEKEFTRIFPRNSRIKPLYKDGAWHLLSVVQFKQLKAVNGDYTKLSSYQIFIKTNAIDPIPDTRPQDFTSAEFTLFSNLESNIGNITVELIDKTWMISRLYINPNHRRLGLGTYLLQYVCQELWDYQVFPVTLDTFLPEDDWLKSWYASMGFKTNSNGMYKREELDYNYGLSQLANFKEDN